MTLPDRSRYPRERVRVEGRQGPWTRHSIERIRSASFRTRVRGYDQRRGRPVPRPSSPTGSSAAVRTTPPSRPCGRELERDRRADGRDPDRGPRRGRGDPRGRRRGRAQAAGRRQHDRREAALRSRRVRGRQARRGRRRLRPQGPRGGRRATSRRRAPRSRPRSSDARGGRARPASHARPPSATERIVGEANKRKADIEALISDLEQRRDAVLAELDRLASGIAGTATEHRPEPRADERRCEAGDEREADTEVADRGGRRVRTERRMGTRGRESGLRGRARGGARRRPGAPPRKDRRAGQARASASGSSGWSTRSRSPRRRCSPTGTPRASAPTASSPAWRTIGGRRVCLMANDPTVKAGSWGPKTVEKILRIQERALSLELPMIYLVDSAGARITDQVQMFPGRRGAGRIFHNEVKLSGRVPQVCLLFGPVGGRRRLHPGLLRRRDHARRQRLDVPRLAADGRDGDRREGHARGDGRGEDAHRPSRAAATSSSRPTTRRSTLASATSPTCRRTGARRRPPAPPGEPATERAVAEIVPDDEKTPFDIKDLIDGAHRRGLVLRGARALGEGAGRRLRAARRAGDRDRRQPAEPEGRRAVRRLGRQGGALHHDLQRLQHPAALPRRRARVHDRHRRSSARGSSATARR